MDRLGVIIVEDDALLRREVIGRIDAEPGLKVIAETGTLAGARRAIERTSAALLLLDLGLPDGNAIAVIPEARARGLAVLILTVSDSERNIYDALAAGAGGYLLKAEALAGVGEALRALSDGGAPISPRIARRLVDEFRTREGARELSPSPSAQLSPREWQVIELFARGATYAEVSRGLEMSLNTVRQHVRHLYEKLHVGSKAEAVMRAYQKDGQ